MASTHTPRTPPSAAAALRQQLWVQRWRTVGAVGALCLGITLLLTVLSDHFWQQAAYSFAIGTSCTVLIYGIRLGAAYLIDRLAAWRALRPGAVPPHGGLQAWLSGWRIVSLALVVAVVVGPPIGLTIGDWLTGQLSASYWRLNRPETRMTLVLSVLGSGAMVVLFATFERLTTARALAEAAQRQAAENQLRLLQSQLEPHMLFNTLANLRVLIGLDPQRAQAMLDHLIAFLRTTLQASQHRTQALAVEFQHLADYLALMAVRMGPRLQVQLDLPEALRSAAVPPLLLQPLVENSIQHGLEPKVEGGRIEVRARVEADTLVLTVRDSGIGRSAAAALPRDTPGGFGLHSTAERLRTLHGDRASLVFDDPSDGEGGTLATLRLPLSTTEQETP